MAQERFPFRFSRGAKLLLAPLGVRPGNSEVVVGDRHLLVRFGLFRVRTTIDNITDVHVSEGYSVVRVLGPRMSLADHGATFGTNADAGVCLEFQQPVTALYGKLILHPGLTVTVDDPEGLARALRQRMEADATA